MYSVCLAGPCHRECEVDLLTSPTRRHTEARCRAVQVYTELFDDATPERMDALFKYLDKSGSGTNALAVSRMQHPGAQPLRQRALCGETAHGELHSTDGGSRLARQ